MQKNGSPTALSKSRDCVLLETASGKGESLLFHNPREVVQCSDVRRLPAALERLDHLRNSGLHLAGYIAYESFPDIGRYAASAPATGPKTSPFLWFGAFPSKSTAILNSVNCPKEISPNSTNITRSNGVVFKIPSDK